MFLKARVDCSQPRPQGLLVYSIWRRHRRPWGRGWIVVPRRSISARPSLRPLKGTNPQNLKRNAEHARHL